MTKPHQLCKLIAAVNFLTGKDMTYCPLDSNEQLQLPRSAWVADVNTEYDEIALTVLASRATPPLLLYVYFEGCTISVGV